MATVTSAEKVHDPLAGKLAPASASVVPDGVAVAVPPGQLVAALAGLAITMPTGRLSVTLAPVMTVAFGLVSVMVRIDFPPAPMVEGAKALATDGPASPQLTADTVRAVPGPAPSGSGSRI